MAPEYDASADRLYLQGCLDTGVTPERGAYTLDAPLVIRSPRTTLNWSGVVLSTDYPPPDPTEYDDVLAR